MKFFKNELFQLAIIVQLINFAAEKEIARTKSLAQSLNVSTEFIDNPRRGPRHTAL